MPTGNRLILKSTFSHAVEQLPRPGYPAHRVRNIRLANNTKVTLRPIRAEDAAIENDFVSGLSSSSRYLRFLYPLRELTPEMLAYFTQIDYQREMALIAVLETPEGEKQIGVARYSVLPDGASCEFAVVVGDQWQGRGLARQLMFALIDAARDHDLKVMEGVVLAENKRMRNFAQSLGFQTVANVEDRNLVRIRLDL